MLGWKNNGSGHVIFDASNSTSPTGSAVSSTDAVTPWAASYPTLMGWNGTSTYGVRVDAAKTAEGARANTFEIKRDGATAAIFSSISTNEIRLSMGAAPTGNLYFSGAGTLRVEGGTTAAIALVAGTTLSILDAVGMRTNGEFGYYGVGTGGVITQLTSKATAVTLNKRCGTITTSNSSMAGGDAVTFVFNNTTFDASDNIILNVVSGTNGAYCLGLDSMNTNYCRITIKNLTNTTIAEAIQIRFTIIKSVNA
jgi:hypothetical protein